MANMLEEREKFSKICAEPIIVANMITDIYHKCSAERIAIEKALEVLEIIFEAPSILEQLFKLGQLGKEAQERYFWGTITDSRVEKVKEFFADGKRDQSK